MAAQACTFPTHPAWEQHERDARQLGTTADRVADFKRRHDLPRAEPLTAAAGALLLQELETVARAHKGRAIERARALAAITERATPRAVMAVAVAVPSRLDLWRALGVIGPCYPVDAYLLDRIEALTGKRYASPGTARKRCEALAPAAVGAAAVLEPFRRALFWGVVLRLDQLEGPPPINPASFYSWCQLAAYASHGADPAQTLRDLLAGRMADSEARALLQLPETGPLAAGAIRDAFRAQARTAHPDTGGDRCRFERLAAARDRLLLGVA
jgi:hypothetical protein